MKKRLQVILLAVICIIGLSSLSANAFGKKPKTEPAQTEQVKKEEVPPLVVEEVDFGPYLRELQRKIKLNWEPPKADKSKRVVLLFTIGKDGSLQKCNVYKSSESEDADKAAMDAVYASQPFEPLPAGFKGKNVDIQFSFDYNVLGSSRY